MGLVSTSKTLLCGRTLVLIATLTACDGDENNPASGLDAGENAGHDAGPPDAAVLWSVDGGAKPSLTADMGPCMQAADCADSPAANSIKNIRCMIEVYCLAGLCHADCMPACTTVRDDENSCDEPKLCKPSRFSSRSFCAALPIACTSPEDCPNYRPKRSDGTQSEWTCEAGICTYPGYEYTAN
jgi:hypothetical protein